MTEPQGRRLHLGCGPGPQPRGWIHIDGSWNAWFAQHRALRAVLRALRLAPRAALDLDWAPGVIVHNVMKGLPFSSSSVSAIYSSHMLEHLYFEDAERVIDECYRVLEPGGILRIVVPDLRAFVSRYVAEVGEMATVGPARLAADALNERLLFRHRHRPKGGVLFRLYSGLNDFHSHKWMYDADSLNARFVKAGFVEIRSMSPHVSRIKDIEQVEAIDRVALDGLCLEAIKPAADRPTT